jgi:hypothetical protein
LGGGGTFIVGWSLLVLLQAPPFAQKNEEGIPTNQVSNKAQKRIIRQRNNNGGGRGGRRYLKMVSSKVRWHGNNSKATSASSKAQKWKQQGMNTREQQGVSTREQQGVNTRKQVGHESK